MYFPCEIGEEELHQGKVAAEEVWNRWQRSMIAEMRAWSVHKGAGKKKVNCALSRSQEREIAAKASELNKLPKTPLQQKKQ